MKHPQTSLAILVAVLCGAVSAGAGGIYFANPTDTIAISGQSEITTAATYEVVIKFPPCNRGTGRVFNEWQAFAEDKLLSVGPTGLCGYNHPLGGGTVLCVNTNLTADSFHHVAFVYDGSEERLYLDGQQVAQRAMSGSVGNSEGPGRIGAIFRDGGVQSSFVGILDAVRLSRVARYAGNAFTPPTGDLTSDADTVLLYNFNEAPGSTNVVDESPLGRTGALGVGFESATAPTFVDDDFNPCCVAPPAGLVTWWPLDELCGPTARDMAGANHGALTGTSVVDGPVGRARRFLPGNALSAAGSGSLNITSQHVTVDAWIKLENSPTTAQTFTGVIGKNGFPNAQTYQIVFESGPLAGNPANTIPTNQWQMEFVLTNDGATRLHDQTTGVILTVDDLYHHFAMTYDGAHVKLYVDGALRYTRAFTGNLLSAPDEPVVVTGFAPFCADEIEIFDRALSAEEIAAIFNAGTAGKCKAELSVPACLLEPAVATNFVGQTHSVTVTVTTNGLAVADVPVCFSVTGVNPASGDATTDANGEAIFQYTGNAAGTDSIEAIASVGGHSTTCTATKVWISPPSEGHDLALVKLKAPKNINLQGAEPSLTKFASVTIQNLSDHAETITSYAGLVTLIGASLGETCPNLAIELVNGPPNMALPVVLAPNKKLNIFFNVTYNCANFPAKGVADFEFTATINHAAMDGNADSNPANDICPRPANPATGDKGCAKGLAVQTDVVVKE
jgi:hypothetical protein